MEDIKAYMETGILELYVLGDISPQEKLQVEEMVAKHPLIKAELEEIELSMELFAQENAIEPNEALRSRILNSVLTNFNDDSTFSTVANKIEDNVISLPAAKSSSFYKYAFAACLALLLASGVALISLYGKLQDSYTQIATLQTNNQHFANQVNFKEGELQVLRDTSFKFLKLQGTAHSPDAGLTVAWSPARKKVWIDLRSLKMPVNDSTHQYQLWALVGGKPVDLGVFDKTADSTDMKEMKSTALADAFAVTLEPKGGSVSPTMDQMMVVGKF
ncbi:anti-sigma factor [Mucilaginibacter sp. X4EP1]|uniref:anti-sigma factor n=1 Tax=Mucilaginibacter sp. X4EP1 TaxID=2723092 RepID=UPI002166EC17|nr:anti-sigma factor [Mucilaginibacter sp. X4EP1]MCS3814271.1 anti-sigma-K factor RskA [Mucilaginibacter sp. X4EP1]